MNQKLKKAQFDFEDYLESVKQMRNMGGLGSIMSMLPGLGGMGGMGKMKGLDDEQTAEAEKRMGRIEALDDIRREKKSRYFESIKKAQNRKRGWSRHQRSKPNGKAVRRDEENDEDF